MTSGSLLCRRPARRASHSAGHAAANRLREILTKVHAEADPAALDTAVDLGTPASAHVGDAERWAVQTNLATALAMRYEHSGNSADNDTSIALLRDVLSLQHGAPCTRGSPTTSPWRYGRGSTAPAAPKTSSRQWTGSPRPWKPPPTSAPVRCSEAT